MLAIYYKQKTFVPGQEVYLASPNAALEYNVFCRAKIVSFQSFYREVFKFFPIQSSSDSVRITSAKNQLFRESNSLDGAQFYNFPVDCCKAFVRKISQIGAHVVNVGVETFGEIVKRCVAVISSEFEEFWH